eukprot:5002882-Alexandrium_andersonii.AAC.1
MMPCRMVIDCARIEARRSSSRAISSGEVKIRPSRCCITSARSQSVRSFRVDIAPIADELSRTTFGSALRPAHVSRGLEDAFGREAEAGCGAGRA